MGKMAVVVVTAVAVVVVAVFFPLLCCKCRQSNTSVTKTKKCRQTIIQNFLYSYRKYNSYKKLNLSIKYSRNRPKIDLTPLRGQ